jgi:hypothetical protein
MMYWKADGLHRPSKPNPHYVRDPGRALNPRFREGRMYTVPL